LIEVGVRVGMISQLESRIDPSLQQRHPRISFSGHVQLPFVDKPGRSSAMGFQDCGNRLVVPFEFAQFADGRWPRRNRHRQIIHGNGDSPLDAIAACDFAPYVACPDNRPSCAKQKNKETAGRSLFGHVVPVLLAPVCQLPNPPSPARGPRPRDPPPKNVRFLPPNHTSIGVTGLLELGARAAVTDAHPHR
jgi:hypothetical protein